MQSQELDAQRRQKNVRTAWILGGFALLIAVSSVPFWKGLFDLAMSSGQ